MSLGNLLILLGFLIVVYSYVLVYRKLMSVSDKAEKYKHILDEVDDGYYEVDLKGICQFATSGLSKIFGHTPEELVGIDFRDIMTREGAEIIYREFNEVFLTGTPVKDIVYEAYTGYGRKVLIESSVETIKNKKGKIIGFKGIARDVSEKVKIEKALKNARVEAKSANELKNSFLANISHEIKTPMSGVIGMAKLLKTTDLTCDQKKQVDIIIKSSEILFRIINDILDFSKIESGKLIIKIQPFDIRAMVDQVKKSLYMDIKEKELDFKVDIDASVPEIIVADELRIQQVVSNILGNAVKFTPQGRIKMSVWVESGKNRNFINFLIADTGIGIRKNELKLIFDNFTRTKNIGSRRHGGTGLGLAITKKLVSLMEGKIGVRSEFGKGSVFKVSIPFSDHNNERIADSYFGSEPEFKEDEPLKVMERWLNENKRNFINVLIAEDNKVNSNLIERHFSGLPFKTDICENGYDVLKKVESAEFDLIIMDVQMPGITGIEAAKQIRAFESENNRVSVPIVAVTAHTMKSDMERCFSAGINAYLGKPVEKQELFHSIACSLSLSSRFN